MIIKSWNEKVLFLPKIEVRCISFTNSQLTHSFSLPGKLGYHLPQTLIPSDIIPKDVEGSFIVDWIEDSNTNELRSMVSTKISISFNDSLISLRQNLSILYPPLKDIIILGLDILSQLLFICKGNKTYSSIDINHFFTNSSPLFGIK